VDDSGSGSAPVVGVEAIRYGVVEDEDVVEAGVRLEAAFQSVVGNVIVERIPATIVPPASGASAETLARFASLPEEKLKAMAALLGV
jgi:hypothetical protein